MTGADILLTRLRTVVLHVDGDGVIRDARGALARVLGAQFAQPAGRRLADLFVAHDAARLQTSLHDGSLAAGRAGDEVVRGLRLAPTDGPDGPDGTDGGDGNDGAAGAGDAATVDAVVNTLSEDGVEAGWVLELLPGGVAAGEPRWARLLDDDPLPSLLATALADLADAGAGGGGRQWTVVLGPRSDDDLLSRVDRSGEVLLADPSTPQDVLDAIAAVGGSGVVPPWRAGPDRDGPGAGLDALPLLVAAAARVHGAAAAALAVAEADGRGPIALLTLFDEPQWARVGSVWQRRADRVARLLAGAIARLRNEERVARAATHDGLTGLVNRHHFLARVEEYPGSVAVLAIDVDGFGTLNSEHGHFCGDRVLTEIARRLRSACRTGDLVARLGGDEFGVALPEAGIDDAVTVGRRVLDAVARPLPDGFGPGAVTVSVGLVRSAADRRGRRDVLDRAQRAQTHARRTGGGRLAVAADTADNVRSDRTTGTDAGSDDTSGTDDTAGIADRNTAGTPGGGVST